MLIDRFAREFDETEVHRIEIAAPVEVVWQELWRLDLLGSPVIKALLALRGLPRLLTREGRSEARAASRRLTLADLEAAGFGRLAEEPGSEVVFGVEGRFWRPASNLSPFRREAFDAPPPAGTCHAYWNFRVSELSTGATELYTETRIRAGDPASRRKFRTYWLFVRPFSGWIRLRMLRGVAKRCVG